MFEVLHIQESKDIWHQKLKKSRRIFDNVIRIQFECLIELYLNFSLEYYNMCVCIYIWYEAASRVLFYFER